MNVKKSLVYGLMMVKNELPLLEVTITYALLNHVDVVYVVDHSSTDGTFECLEAMQQIWGDRLQVFHLGDNTAYYQEATINMLLEIVNPTENDWVYIFDADEFLVIPQNNSLKHFLSTIDMKFSIVQYKVCNYVSTTDFNESDFDSYRNLYNRSVTSFVHMNNLLCEDEIKYGNLNFFDIEFPSKILFKGKSYWVGAGAHSLRYSIDSICNISEDKLFVAHLSHLTRTRIAEKAKQGESLIKNLFPASHGWQNQMLYKMSCDGKLESFWLAHSIGNSNINRTLPSVTKDGSFVDLLLGTLTFLSTQRAQIHNVDNYHINTSSKISLSAAINALYKSCTLKSNFSARKEVFYVQLFLGIENCKFNELFSSKSVNRSDVISVAHMVKAGILTKLRFDPSNNECVVSNFECCLIDESGIEHQCTILKSNATLIKDGTYYFETKDSQFHLSVPISNPRFFRYSFDVEPLEDSAYYQAYIAFNKYLD